ncbi:MAG TPA: carboxylesterase family protein [Terriglobales bacterium]|nr:carboxylesterase family protein [Terriglobales bacterium]
MENKYGRLVAQTLPLYGISNGPDGGVSQAESDLKYGKPGDQFNTDITFLCPSSVVAEWNSRAGNATYQYQFSLTVPGHPEVGAPHASEIPYVFGTLDEQRPMRPDYQPPDYAASKAMQEYWTNFAKTASPDGRGVPGWPEYKADTKKYIEFTKKGVETGADLRQKQCEAFARWVKIKGEKSASVVH